MIDDKNIFTKLEIIHNVVEVITNTTDGEDYAQFMMNLFTSILTKSLTNKEEQILENRKDSNLSQAIKVLKSEIANNQDAAKIRIDQYRKDFKSSSDMMDEGGL